VTRPSPGPAPSGEELESRHSRLRGLLERQGLDGAIFTRPQNIYYLSDYRAAPIAAWTSRFHALAVPSAGRPRLVARQLEAAAAALQWTPDPLLYPDHADPYAMLADEVRTEPGWAGADRIGIEKRYLSVAQHESLATVLPGTELVDISGEVEALAAELSAWELECMRRAAAVTTAGMDTALATVMAGRYPYDVVGAVQQAMYAHGQSDFEDSFVAVWSGPRGGMMHDTRTTDRFDEGDIVTIEIMGVDRHYTACAQTSMLVGEAEPSPAVADAYELVIAMHAAASGVIRAGVAAGAVFEAADTLYRAATGAHYFRRVGGSLGLTMFALDLVKDSPVVLPLGTPLLVQVLLNEPALLTCTSSVIVTEEGWEELTPPIVSDLLCRTD
jgi:Xaa-Pro dipeptidase